MLKTTEEAEAVILELMRRFTFDCTSLKEQLSSKASPHLIDLHPTNCRYRA